MTKKIDTYQRRYGVRWGGVLAYVDTARRSLQQASSIAFTDMLTPNALTELNAVQERLGVLLQRIEEEEERANVRQRKKRR